MLFGLPNARDWLMKRNLFAQDVYDQASLMARVSHELRTSLTGIVGYAEFLENRSVEPMMNFTAKIIRESGSNLTRSCNSYVDLQYLQRGQVRLVRESFNLSDLLQELVDWHHPQALERGIHLQCSCAQDARVTSISADTKRVRQILDALIFNAIQMAETWDAINIHLSLREGEKFLKLGIESTQMKLDQEKLKLEEKFWNTDAYEFCLQDGPGVEMALAKSLIHLAGCSARYAVTQGHVGTLQLTVPVSSLKRV
jgi:signal transduction histidine kinase